MTIHIGRVSLRTPRDVEVVRRNTLDSGRLVTGYENPLNNAIGSRGYMLNGLQIGAAADSDMEALDLEAARLGAVYCSDDSAAPAVSAGYYALNDLSAKKPRGAPGARPWSATLWQVPMPFMVRQAEADNVAGADAADVTADEGNRVDYVTTGAYAGVLRPRGIAAAEPLNMPAGNYRATLRAWAVATGTAQARWLLTDLAGATLATGAAVTVATIGGWAYYDLGILALPQANTAANWYDLEVRDTVNAGSTVRLDALIIRPTV